MEESGTPAGGPPGAGLFAPGGGSTWSPAGAEDGQLLAPGNPASGRVWDAASSFGDSVEALRASYWLKVRKQLGRERGA